MPSAPFIARLDELIELHHQTFDARRPDLIRRFELDQPSTAPIQITAEVCTEHVPGPPGDHCMIFFNLEYTAGPVFWDTFLYPAAGAGSTPWRTLTTEVRSRGQLNAIEMHIRMPAAGRLRVRNVTVRAIEPWPDDADCVIAVFGDSTDMTCYLPHPLRLTDQLELLLADRFADGVVSVRNLAEGGEFLQRVLESGRLDRELELLPRCDLVMIRYGLNDASKKIDPAAFSAQLHDACDRINTRWPKAQIVLSTTIPPLGEPYDPQTIAVARARGLPLLRLDEHLRRRSAAGDCDWHRGPGSFLGRRRDANPPDNPTGLKGDLHPNAYGARLIAEFYFAGIEAIVANVLGAAT